MLTVYIGNFDDGNIKGTTTQVVHSNGAIAFGFVHAISKGCSGGLVDDALNVQACDFACVFGGLALGVVEVSWHRNNRFGDFLAR